MFVPYRLKNYLTNLEENFSWLLVISGRVDWTTFKNIPRAEISARKYKKTIFYINYSFLNSVKLGYTASTLYLHLSMIRIFIWIAL